MPREEINLICEKISLHRILQTKNSWSFVCVTPAPCCKKTPLFQPSDIYLYIYIYLLYLLQVNSRTLPTFSVMTCVSIFWRVSWKQKKSSRNEYRKPAKKYFYHAYLDHVDHFVFLSDLKRQVRCGVLWWKLKCCCRFLGWGHGRCEFLIFGLEWLVCSRLSELIVVLFSGGKVWLILFYIYSGG